ncbi:EamA family transporter [Flammeovirga yaeyamensis]|uniref:EamA family transporter n=1 Tax=Flammeovirga yaeyamensis TaxID=367791 RepID=A0AAX1MYH0_9BACT|nr:DMT family transporter [Flammeovirga yaeyamensis]MBB3696195.1 drug/metabolite transporter (DMT)-like permease [Flammeovirga yaeyamensis]NMF34878.1 DMT family transporter [Flammeovirga yaeyamensis]QWG00295.1 EamA family transporter [Flammeovirga yaeyamensis]
MLTNKTKFYFFLIFTTLIWGVNFHVSQIAIEHVGAMLAGTYRYILGALLLGAFMFFKKPTKKDIKQSLSKWKHIVFLGITGAFLYNILFLEGLKHTTAFNGVLIIGLTPLNTALISIPMLGHRLKRKEMISIALGFMGILFVISKGDLEVIRALSFSKGDLLILGANLSFSFGNVFIKKYLGHISPLWLTNLVTWVACFAFCIYSVGFETFVFPMDTDFLLAVFFMGALSTAICGAFWFISIKELGAETSTLFTNLVPVFGTTASFILGEEISIGQVFGGILVITALLINSIQWRKKKAIEAVSL